MATKTQREPRTSRLPLAVAALLLVAAGVAVWYFEFRDSGPAEPPGLTAEAKVYTRSLSLANVEMKAKDSFMGSTLVEITGQIGNRGNRVLRLVEINCVFYDVSGQVILRERVPIVRPKGGPLRPGETRDFRLPFDSIPNTWNQALPQLVIAHIDFQE